MKKVVLAIAVVALLGSCKKKEDEGPCNCGVVQSDNVQNYTVVIKNDCTGNNKEFTLSEADWMKAYVGSNYCITNASKW
jgi:nitrous oxide reductase accessory protein NosL